MASLFSTTSQIAAINTRARSGVITLPLTTASLYRQIMIKDLYGAFPLSTLTLSTQLGDAFEDGTTSRILSNAYEFQALYAGSTSRWHTVGGTQFTAAYISSLRVDSLQLGSGDGWADFGPLRATAISSLLVQTGLVQANAMSTFAISTGTLNAGNVSTLSLNVGSLSSINISTLNLAAGSISTITLGAGTAYITNLFVGTEDFGSALTASSNITQTAGTTTLTGLSVNTISTNQINSSNICNAGWFSNNGVLSNITAGAFFQATSNTTTLGVAQTATFASNITQTGGTTTLAGLSVNTISTNNITASNISTNSISTNFGFFFTISTASIYGKHIGDGSLLTGITGTGGGGVTSTLSTLVFLTSTISTANLTSQQGYISSLTVDYLAIGSNYGYVNMGDIIATSLSSIAIETQTLTTSNLKVGIVSSLSYIAFPGLQQGYAQSVVAEQSTGTGLQELLIFRGSSASDRIRMQTTGSIVFEPGVSARVYPAVPSNVTPAMIINTSSNVGIGIAAPTVSLDVAGAGRFTAVSTNTVSTNQVNSSNICNAGWFSNNGVLSNTTAGAFFQATSNTTTLGVAGIATFASNITQTAATTTLAGLSVNTVSTNQINSSNICNAGWFSNNGVLSNTAAGAFFQATSNTTTLGVAGIATFASNITQTAATTTLAGLSVNTISTNIVNAGYLVGLLPGNTATTSVSPLAVTNGNAYLSFSPQIEFQYNSGGYKHFMGSRHEGSVTNSFGNAIDFWLYSATGGAGASTTPGTCNVNTMSVTAAGVGIFNNSPSLALDVAGAGRFTAVSTITISTNTILANNISTASLAAYEGFFSTFGSELSYSQEAYFSTIFTENLIGQHAFMSSIIVNSIQIGETTGFITMGDVLTNSISTNTLNTSNISNAGNFSNSGSATFFSNGTTAASPSTTNAYPYASFKINSASTNTLTPVTPLLLMTGNYGGSIAGGLTQGIGPVLTLGTIPDGGATQEGYRLTGSNSAFYGNVNMQGNNISNINYLYGATGVGVIFMGASQYFLGNAIDMGSGNINRVGQYYNDLSDITMNAVAGYSINQTGSNINLNASSINMRGTSNTKVQIGPRQYQGTAADTTTYGLERSRHEIQFAGYRDAQIDKIGSKIVNINKQTYGNAGLRHLIQSADLAFFTVPPDTSDIDNTVERMRITDGGNVGIGTTAPTVSLDVAGAGRFTALSTTTISTGTVYGTFIGNGSGITGISGGGSIPSFLSTNNISTGIITTSNIRVGTISTNSYVSYPGLAEQYTQSILAEQGTGTGLQEMLIFRGSSASDRIRLQTTGYIVFETGVGARVYPTITSNATPSWMIDVNGCVGVGLIPSGTASKLDVAGQGRFQNLSTTSIQAGSMNLSVAFV